MADERVKVEFNQWKPVEVEVVRGPKVEGTIAVETEILDVSNGAVLESELAEADPVDEWADESIDEPVLTEAVDERAEAPVEEPVIEVLVAEPVKVPDSNEPVEPATKSAVEPVPKSAS